MAYFVNKSFELEMEVKTFGKTTGRKKKVKVLLFSHLSPLKVITAIVKLYFSGMLF